MVGFEKSEDEQVKKDAGAVRKTDVHMHPFDGLSAVFLGSCLLPLTACSTRSIPRSLVLCALGDFLGVGKHGSKLVSNSFACTVVGRLCDS